MGSNKSKFAFEICIVSTDYKEVEDQPAIYMVLFDEQQRQSPTLSYTDLIQIENDKIQAKFSIENNEWCKLRNFSRIEHLELWRSNDSVIPFDWFLDKIIVRDRRMGLRGYWEYSFFPLQQWIEGGRHYIIYDCETFKAHEDPFPDIRSEEIRRRSEAFVLCQRASGFPVEIETVPEEETFGKSSKWDIDDAKFSAISQRHLSKVYDNKSPWESLDALNSLYSKYNITEPTGLKNSIINDICFGAQRLKGCNPFVLKLCTKIPDNFEISEEWFKPHLEGWTVSHVIKARRLYMVDYKVMEGLNCKTDRVMPAPIAIFFFTESKQLKPLAIQLTQSSDNGNLVFLPSDPPAKWLLAKMWFNMVDACHHLIVGRLLNQMILENIYVSMRKNFGRSHPIYQILAPHFTNCLVVSKKLKESVFNKDGWIAKNIQLSKKGIKKLLKKAFKKWSFEINANIHKDLESRKVYDLKALNNYPYRDDALLIHEALTSYIRKLVKVFYPDGRVDLLVDDELQNWRRDLAELMGNGGMGLKGIPGEKNSKTQRVLSVNNNDKIVLKSNGSLLSGDSQTSGNALLDSLRNTEDLISLLTGILYLSVIVCGSALRLPMYDEYGYPVNYPTQLIGDIPTDTSERPRDTEESSHDDDDMETVIQALPNKHCTLDVLLSIRMSARVTQSGLGKYDIDYIYKKEALVILEEFRKRLHSIRTEIDARNRNRDIYHQYYAMDPRILPNCPGV